MELPKELLERYKPTQQKHQEQLQVEAVPVNRIVCHNDTYYYEVVYRAVVCRVKLLKFEVDMLEQFKQKKTLNVIYRGLDDYGNIVLVQDKATLINELYEADTVHTFRYLATNIDYNNEFHNEFHVLIDQYGLKHRYYGPLDEEFKKVHTCIQMYVKSISPNGKHLNLVPHEAEKVTVKKCQVFSEIDKESNDEQLNVDKVIVETVTQTMPVSTNKIQEKLFVSINDDNTVNVSTETGNSSNVVKQFVIDTQYDDGIVLLFMNDGEICKLRFSDLAELDREQNIMSELSPYKICNIFVVPSRCILGVVTKSESTKWIIMYDSDKMDGCTISDLKYNIIGVTEIARNQAFILPLDYNDILSDYIGRKTDIGDVPEDIAEFMKTFGIYIK